MIPNRIELAARAMAAGANEYDPDGERKRKPLQQAQTVQTVATIASTSRPSWIKWCEARYLKIQVHSVT